MIFDIDTLVFKSSRRIVNLSFRRNQSLFSLFAMFAFNNHLEKRTGLFKFFFRGKICFLCHCLYMYHSRFVFGEVIVVKDVITPYGR